MSGDERSRDALTTPPPSLPGAERLEFVRTGELDLLGLMPRSSNHTFLARLREPGAERTPTSVSEDGVVDVDPATTPLAIYKPRRGERPLWDFPPGTLCAREVAAFEVASVIGWPAVPPTVLRDGPEGIGSVQLFVDLDPAEHYFTMEGHGREDDFRRIALFDAVVNNTDRKSGHVLLARDGHVFVIDHGVCFSVEPKLRTVIWTFAGEPIPSGLRADLERARPALDPGGSLGPRLTELLSAEESAVTAARWDRLLADGRFPEPADDVPPYPWPPV